MKPNILQQLDPLQQLVVKMNNMQTPNQTQLVQAQSNAMPMPSQQPANAAVNEDTQQNNPIHNLLKQLGVSTEKSAKVRLILSVHVVRSKRVFFTGHNLLAG